MSTTFNMSDILYVATAITAISVALNWIFKGIGYLTSPNRKQDNLLNEHQIKLGDHDERLATLEEQDHLVMQGIFALLEHSLDGNSVEEMKRAKDDIQKFLISK